MLASSVLAGFVFTVAAVAQTTRLAFTTFPTLEGVTAGQPFTLRWQGGDGSPVTITLREGDMTNLNTISVITGDATGNSFVWTPRTSLPNAKDYALEISQGTSEPNYSGEFPITGGVSTTTLSSASSVLSTVTVAQSTVTSTLITTFASSVANATVTLSGGSVTLSGPGSAGTGVPSVSRNTTFSSPTLATTATVISAGAPSTTVEATTTVASAGSSTAGAAASSSTSSGAGVVQTSFGLALAGVVGLAFVFFC